MAAPQREFLESLEAQEVHLAQLLHDHRDARLASVFLEEALAMVRGLREAFRDSRQELERQCLSAGEDQFLTALQPIFWLVRIPSDGNCLFDAVSRVSCS